MICVNIEGALWLIPIENQMLPKRLLIRRMLKSCIFLILFFFTGSSFFSLLVFKYCNEL